ncbi:MAG TPA: ATP-binding protein, partial [Chryseolinea sp.]|nr:ATP-binding protein [Chryseolinea sp.]
KIAEKSHDAAGTAAAYDWLSVVYHDEEDVRHCLLYSRKAFAALELSKSVPGYEPRSITVLTGVASALELNSQFDSAIYYCGKVDSLNLKLHGTRWAPISYLLGNIYFKMGKLRTALQHYERGIMLASAPRNNKDLMDIYSGVGNCYKAMGNYDSAIYWSAKVLNLSKSTRYSIAKLKGLTLLADVYKAKHKGDSVAKYLQLTIATKDSLFSRQKIMQLQGMTFNEQLRQLEIEDDRQQYQSRLRTYFLGGGLLAALLTAGLLYRSSRHKQKAKQKIELAYDLLKSTQSQLIQSEKMASLGELTAGIAHEIQNPLNFVNNFSEINTELISEMKHELSKGNVDGAGSIATDICENEKKIVYHGKRADSIVKGMLQHSRTNSGEKEPTEINALADRYLRLAYHGLRAKDKSFNVRFETDLDPTVGKINVAPQEIGRVLLNLLNNAFHAVSDRQAHVADIKEKAFEPIVTLETKRLDNRIEIKIIDNGIGIPADAVHKIFQPFFTTKPTGQGTGLGLSISYDIITNGHGGELNVQTKEGTGTTFIVILPC